MGCASSSSDSRQVDRQQDPASPPPKQTPASSPKKTSTGQVVPVYYSPEDCDEVERRHKELEGQRSAQKERDEVERLEAEKQRKLREDEERRRLEEEWRAHDDESRRAQERLKEELANSEQDVLVL